MPAPEGGKTEGVRVAGSGRHHLEPILGISYTHNPQKVLLCVLHDARVLRLTGARY